MNPELYTEVALSPELQNRLSHFNTIKAAYVEAQERFSTFVQGEEQLRQRAAQLEKMADATDASWKKLAVSQKVEQADINAEIEHATKLREEAKALSLTADARSHLKGQQLIQLAELRMKLRGSPDAVNNEYLQDVLTQVLGQEGLRESLLQAFTLCRDLYLGNLTSREPRLQFCSGQRERQEMIAKGIWKAFSQELEGLFAGAEKHTKSPALAFMPPTVAHEIVTESPVALMKLKREHMAD